MKVLLKSLKELKEEYDIEENDGFLIIDGHDITVVPIDIFKLLGKTVEADYIRECNYYIINDYWVSHKLIKGEVINEETIYTIKRLSDGKAYTFSL